MKNDITNAPTDTPFLCWFKGCSTPFLCINLRLLDGSVRLGFYVPDPYLAPSDHSCQMWDVHEAWEVERWQGIE